MCTLYGCALSCSIVYTLAVASVRCVQVLCLCRRPLRQKRPTWTAKEPCSAWLKCHGGPLGGLACVLGTCVCVWRVRVCVCVWRVRVAQV